MSQQDRTLSVEDAARACDVSVETIRRRLRARRLVGAFQDGPLRTWRIPVSALIADGFRIDTSDHRAHIERLERELELERTINARLTSDIDLLERYVRDLRNLLGMAGEP